MNAGDGQVFYYWVEEATMKVLGRSNSETYARRMAERYSHDTARFAACAMLVVTDPSDVAGSMIARYDARPGVRWLPAA